MLTACTLQIRPKGEDENLAEWIVDITTEADRQGSDRFLTAYQACACSLHATVCRTLIMLIADVALCG